MTANLPRRCYRIAAVCAAFLGTACSDGKEFAIVKERQGNYDLVRAEIVQPFEANGIELKAVLTVTCDLEPEQPRILIAAMGFVKGEDDYEPAPDLDPEFRIGSVLASRGAFSTGYWGTSMRTGLAHFMVFNLSKIFESRKFDLESARGAEERARAALDSATAPIALTKELEARRDSVMEVAFPPGSATRANRSEPLAQLAMALVDSIAWQTRDNTLHLRDPDSWGSEWPTAIEGGNTLNLSLSSDPEWLRPCMATVKTAEETYLLPV